MNYNDIHILDCTLRDGGYVNDWKWGYKEAREIIYLLTKSRVDVVEVGFLRNIDTYSKEITVCDNIADLNKFLPDKQDCENTMYSAMAMRSNYNIEKLEPYCGKGIEMIRVTAHDYDIEEGLEFARKVKEKGYKVSINPINIMGYTDEQLLVILKNVNEIMPYQFSIVDTFGSMRRRDLDRIVSLVDNNLDRTIRVALHLHENMSLSCCLAQEFIAMHLNRPVAIDGSLMGMGRNPGNLPIELIADYLNEVTKKSYEIDYMLDAIWEYISPIHGNSEWGYNPVYFLSARYNLHRNYAEHYLNKDDLTNRDINHILSRIPKEKKTVFDSKFADKLYAEYLSNKIDDSAIRVKLKSELAGRKILLLAPGSSIATCHQEIEEYIRVNQPTIISLNFVTDKFPVDYIFFSNNKRHNKIHHTKDNVILTSNLREKAQYVIDYNSIQGAFRQGGNAFIMLLNLLKQLGIDCVAVAGADGYCDGKKNYYDTDLCHTCERSREYNLDVAEAVRNVDMEIEYITPSAYAEL